MKSCLIHCSEMFVCAHELGHMFLHKKANAIFMDSRTQLTTSKYENEADQFAADLLIPDDIIGDNIDLTLDQLSRLFGYSKRLIKLRLLDY